MGGYSTPAHSPDKLDSSIKLTIQSDSGGCGVFPRHLEHLKMESNTTWPRISQHLELGPYQPIRFRGA